MLKSSRIRNNQNFCLVYSRLKHELHEMAGVESDFVIHHVSEQQNSNTLG